MGDVPPDAPMENPEDQDFYYTDDGPGGPTQATQENGLPDTANLANFYKPHIIADRVLLNTTSIIIPLLHMFALLRLLPRLTKATKMHWLSIFALVSLLVGVVGYDIDYAVQPLHRTVGRLCTNKYRIPLLILNIPYIFSNAAAFIYAILKFRLANIDPKKFTSLQKIALLASLLISGVHLGNIFASYDVVFQDDTCGWSPKPWLLYIQAVVQPFNHVLLVAIVFETLRTQLKVVNEKGVSPRQMTEMIRSILLKGRHGLQRTARVGLFLNAPGRGMPRVEPHLHLLRSAIIKTTVGLIINIGVWITISVFGETAVGWRYALVELSYAITWLIVTLIPPFVEELGHGPNRVLGKGGVPAASSQTRQTGLNGSHAVGGMYMKDVDFAERGLNPNGPQSPLTPMTPTSPETPAKEDQGLVDITQYADSGVRRPPNAMSPTSPQ